MRKRRQVVAVEVGPRHQALVLHRHQHGVRGAVRAAPAAGSRRRRTSAISTTRAAAGQRREEHRPAWCSSTAAWRAASPLSGRSRTSRRALHVRPAHAVRLHDALGRAGGARRIDDVEGPVGLRSPPAPAARRPAPARRRARVPGGDAVERDAARAARRRRQPAAAAAASTNSSRAPRVVAASPRSCSARDRRRQRRHRHAGAQRAQEHAPRSSGVLCAQIAIASPGCRPSRCSAAATRSISASSAA